MKNMPKLSVERVSFVYFSARCSGVADMYVSLWNGRGLAFASFGGSEVDAI